MALNCGRTFCDRMKSGLTVRCCKLPNNTGEHVAQAGYSTRAQPYASLRTSITQYCDCNMSPHSSALVTDYNLIHCALS